MKNVTQQRKIVIVGAGIGGLSAALILGARGAQVTVLEARDAPGGKMRTVPTAAGPVDAGPTVLTMRGVFDDLFARAGLRLQDHATLHPLNTLARHYWRDGTCLDLMADADASADRVRAAFGAASADQFRAFSARADRLFAAFEGPMMKTGAPSVSRMGLRVARQPGLIRDMAPLRSLRDLVRDSFTDPRLAQLFARYATYVGGAPGASPALLSLIWAAEARGVWTVEGGMHALAQAVADAARHVGADLRFGQRVETIDEGVVTTASETFPADAVLFNGDPKALHDGLLGGSVQRSVGGAAVAPRSLSADVASFAAVPNGLDLSHHTVLFADTPDAEFDAIAQARTPDDATLYICAPDHDAGPGQPQRFEVIRNAPALPHNDKEPPSCQQMIFDRMRAFGLTFSTGPVTMTGPAQFARMFPGSDGALYGRSPHGTMAAFKRPTARSGTKGLYLCGGGAHPGAGVPMAALSGVHAAEAMMNDLSLT